MRYYPLHELSPDVFEDLVVLLCHKVLGIGTINFAEGKDGGRDAKFEGIANAYPSANSPWSGKFIVQAKRTSNPIASCSDAEFSKVLNDEKPKLVKLRDAGEMDNYLLFTNRKLPANTEAKQVKGLKNELAIKNVALIGLEKIALHLDTFPDIAKQLNLRVLQEPLRIRFEDVKTLLESLMNKGFDVKKQAVSATSFDMIELEAKNVKNRLSYDYFTYIEQSSRPYFHQIEEFLENSINEVYTEFYYHLVDELNQRLYSEKQNNLVFDQFLVSLYDGILDKVPLLAQKPKLVSVFVHYMYVNCDLGQK